MTDDRLVLHGSFTSSSTYKPMLFLALAGLPFSLDRKSTRLNSSHT